VKHHKLDVDNGSLQSTAVFARAWKSLLSERYSLIDTRSFIRDGAVGAKVVVIYTRAITTCLGEHISSMCVSRGCAYHDIITIGPNKLKQGRPVIFGPEWYLDIGKAK
jgi:hypothetical protein